MLKYLTKNYPEQSGRSMTVTRSLVKFDLFSFGQINSDVNYADRFEGHFYIGLE